MELKMSKYCIFNQFIYKKTFTIFSLDVVNIDIPFLFVFL